MPEHPIFIKQGLQMTMEQKSMFYKEIEDLTSRLTIILRDTTQVNVLKLKADPEMMADLYFNVAKGYSNNPEVTTPPLTHPISISLYLTLI
jgi:hypothetical protein